MSDELLFKKPCGIVWKRLGKQPGIKEMEDPATQGEFGATAYKTRFGTWTNALRKFIEYQNDKRPGSGEIKHRLKIVRRGAGAKNKRVKGNGRYISPYITVQRFLRDGFRCMQPAAAAP